MYCQKVYSTVLFSELNKKAIMYMGPKGLGYRDMKWF